MKKLISLLLCFAFTFIGTGCRYVSEVLTDWIESYRFANLDNPMEINSNGDYVLEGKVYKEVEDRWFCSPELLLGDELIAVGEVLFLHYSENIYVSDRDIEKNILADPNYYLHIKQGFELPNLQEITYSKIVMPVIKYSGSMKAYSEDASWPKLQLEKSAYLRDIFDMGTVYEDISLKTYYRFYLQSADYPYLGWGYNQYISISESNELYLMYSKDSYYSKYYKVKDEYVVEFERMIAECKTLQATETTN